MYVSAKCSIALHCLLFIAEYSGDRKVTSALLARSTGCNAVTIRNILGDLREAGLIQIARGVGGATLARQASEITVWQVYSALDPQHKSPMIALPPHPYERCPIGAQITQVLEETYQQVESSVKREMSEITLEQIQRRYHQKSKAGQARQDHQGKDGP